MRRDDDRAVESGLCVVGKAKGVGIAGPILGVRGEGACQCDQTLYASARQAGTALVSCVFAGGDGAGANSPLLALARSRSSYSSATSHLQQPHACSTADRATRYPRTFGDLSASAPRSGTVSFHQAF